MSAANENLLFDAHLDLALNALEWNRDLTRPMAEIRAREAGLKDKPGRGQGTVCFPELRRGNIAVVVATQIARVDTKNALGIVARWNSPAQAWSATQAQLAWYKTMEEAGELTPIRSREELDHHLAHWQKGSQELLPVGYILSLEGADSLVTLAHLARAHAQGLRAVGPAHYGEGIYAPGTNASGGFPPRGRELLKEMDRLGMILDVTHLTDECFWEAMDLYTGPIWASHNNCRALVPHQRQLSDEQIRALVQGNSVIGVALDAWMLMPDWVKGQTTPQAAGLRLEAVVKHIDHICQIAGNARHVGIGSDLDGAFGREQTPLDVETIADLQRIPELLKARGHDAEDLSNIRHENFRRFLEASLV